MNDLNMIYCVKCLYKKKSEIFLQISNFCRLNENQLKARFLEQCIYIKRMNRNWCHLLKCLSSKREKKIKDINIVAQKGLLCESFQFLLYQKRMIPSSLFLEKEKRERTITFMYRRGQFMIHFFSIFSPTLCFGKKSKRERTTTLQ